MKYSSLAALFVMAVTVGTARADISLQWRRVTADSGTLESQHAADVPGGFKSWQLLVTTDTKWIGSDMDLLLDEGTIYYNDFGNNNNPTPPDAALFGPLPSTRFGSHLSGTGLDPADGQRQTPSFAPDPVRPNKGKMYTDKEITTTWLTPDPPGRFAGTHVIAMLTLSDHAQGSVSVDAVEPQICPGPDVPGRECTIPPFILDYPIVDGEIIVPEPSAALLAVLGLLGLIFVIARRRSTRVSRTQPLPPPSRDGRQPPDSFCLPPRAAESPSAGTATKLSKNGRPQKSLRDDAKTGASMMAGASIDAKPRGGGCRCFTSP